MRETEQLATYMAELKFEDLPTDVVATAKMAIRDIVGVTLFASRLEWSGIVADFAQDAGGSGPSTVWGRSTRTSAPYAALANGTAAHGIEMDDRSHTLEIHNGAATVSAAVALAEHAGVSGRDLILAVVCGYEVAFRVARATHGGIWPRFYSDGIRAFFGAASAAAKVLSLDTRGYLYALGSTGSMAGGLMEHTLDPHGTMTKRLQGGGWQAYAGVTAALLARRGFTAPSSILEGANGFCRAFCTEKDPDIPALTRDLGMGFEMRHWETKAYATRGAYGTAIEAVTRLREQHGIQADQVRRLVGGCSSRIFGNANTGRPQSVMAAQYNLPFVLATAFFHDLRDPSTWTEHILADQHVSDLLDRTEVIVDEDVERYYRESRVAGGVKVTAELLDGRVVSETVLHTKGTPENPLTAADVAGKYRLLSGYALSAQQADDLGAYLDHLEDQEDPLDLSRFTGANVAI